MVPMEPGSLGKCNGGTPLTRKSCTLIWSERSRLKRQIRKGAGMPESIVTISLSADAGAIHLWHIVIGAAVAAVFSISRCVSR